MPQQIASGRWRTRVRDPRTGKQIAAHTVIGGPTTFDSAEAARSAEREAAVALAEGKRNGVTVAEFWQEWTTDAMWARDARSTNLHNAERTRSFVAKYGNRPMRAIDDDVAIEWIAGGRNHGTVPALRAFFNDARSAKAGRLVKTNPFAGLGLKTSRGRKDKQPPSQAKVAEMIEWANRLTPPSFAAYLHTAAFEGARPGELDALRWSDVDFPADRIRIERQWNAKTREFTLPKHGVRREIGLTDVVRDRLLALPRETEFVFTTLRGTHYTPSARSTHWNRVRCAAGIGNMDLYTCTRHFFGWYAMNVKRLDPHDIAKHFGHQDGGELVRKLYGHPDEAIAADNIVRAFASAPTAPTPMIRRRAASA